MVKEKPRCRPWAVSFLLCFYLSLLLSRAYSQAESGESEREGEGSYTTPEGIVLHWVLDKASEEVTFVMEAETLGWLGLSVLAKPGRMFPADAVIAQPGSPSPTIKSYKFTSHVVSGENQVDPAQRIFDASLTNNGTFSRLQFTRKLNNGGDQPLSLSQANHLGWAYSPSSALTQHAARGALSLTFSGSKSGKIDLVKHPKEKEYLIHGYLNVIAWCFLIPMGVFTVMILRLSETEDPFKMLKTNKDVPSTSTSNIKPDAKRKAVRTHLLANLAAVTLTSVAVLYAILTFYDKAKIKINSHALLGLITACLAILNVFGGILRPAPSHSSRPVWSFLHKNGGRIIAIVLLTNVFLGIEEYSKKMKGYEKQSYLKTKQGLLTIALMLLVAAVPTAGSLGSVFISTKFPHRRKRKTKVECSSVELTGK